MNVYQRIQKVMAGLPYIQKKKAMSVGASTIKTLSYEDLAAEVQPLLISCGLVMESRLHKQTTEIHESEKPGFNGGPPKKVTTTIATVEMQFRLVNVEDPTDKTEWATFPGMGFDTSDKAMGKATTYAAKDFIRKTFVVPSGEEPEDDNHERPSVKANEDFPPTSGPIGKPVEAKPAASDPIDPRIHLLLTAAKDKIGREPLKAWMLKNYPAFDAKKGGTCGLSEEGATDLCGKLRELTEAKK